MAQPGWYADPSAPDGRRYWDGARWQEAAPQQRKTPPGWLWMVLALVVIGGLVAALMLLPNGVNPFASTPTDTNTSRPTGSQWNELSPEPSPTATSEPSKGESKPCPEGDFTSEHGPSGNTYYSTGMQYDGVPGWSMDGAFMVHFANDRTGQLDQVTSGWVAATAMGGLGKADYSGDPRTAANQVADCLATSAYYDALSHTEIVEDRAYATADGVTGWLLVYNFWNKPNSPVLGDEVVVLVLDSGVDGKLAVFHSQAPTDDQRRQDLVEAAMQSLRRR